MYVYHVVFIYFSVDGHFRLLPCPDFVNSAAVNIEVHVFFQIMVFSGSMPRNGVIRSYGSSIFSL